MYKRMISFFDQWVIPAALAFIALALIMGLASGCKHTQAEDLDVSGEYGHHVKQVDR